MCSLASYDYQRLRYEAYLIIYLHAVCKSIDVDVLQCERGEDPEIVSGKRYGLRAEPPVGTGIESLVEDRD